MVFNIHVVLPAAWKDIRKFIVSSTSCSLLTQSKQQDKTAQFVAKCQTVIHRVAGKLIQEKKRKIQEAEMNGEVYQGKDLLSLLCKHLLTISVSLSDSVSQ